jgi:putative ABC transport system substrate-binding protein
MLKKKIMLSLVLSAALISIVGCAQKAGNTTKDAGGAATAAATSAATTAAAKQYKIAISQIVEHPSLDATREGFLAALKDAGIVEGTNLKVDYNCDISSTASKKNTCTIRSRYRSTCSENRKQFG